MYIVPYTIKSNQENMHKMNTAKKSGRNMPLNIIIHILLELILLYSLTVALVIRPPLVTTRKEFYF